MDRSEPTNVLADTEVSSASSDTGQHRAAYHERNARSANCRAGARGFAPGANGKTGWQPSANLPSVARPMSSPLPKETDTRLLKKRAGEQALYALMTRHFLEMSRVYFELESPAACMPVSQDGVGGTCDLPSAGRRHPAPLFKRGDQHVVG